MELFISDFTVYHHLRKNKITAPSGGTLRSSPDDGPKQYLL